MEVNEAIEKLNCIYMEVSTDDDREAIDMAIEALNRPHGEWIEANSTDLKCSICGHRELKERTLATFLNYCSLCGAKMDNYNDD